MPVTDQQDLISEIVEFLSSCPTGEEILKYHPSESVQQRSRELLSSLNEGSIDRDGQKELDQFQFAEVLMRSLKARVRAKLVSPK